jgi:hypothetical protein
VRGGLIRYKSEQITDGTVCCCMQVDWMAMSEQLHLSSRQG